mgnify:CR=1 FL=1
MKVYGNEKTNLVLSDKAEAIYNECDPIKIIEQDDGTYSLRGFEHRDGMTAEEVNAWFEDLADELWNQ